VALIAAPVLAGVLTNSLSDDDEKPPPSSTPSPPSKGRPDLYVSSRSTNEWPCIALATTPTSPADRASLATGEDVPGLVKRHRGAHIDQLDVDITLQGGERGLTIESIDIEPRTSRPDPPLDGGILCWISEGDAPKLKLMADLDDPNPYLHEEKSPELPHFRDRVITLAPQEQVSIQASFHAKRGYRQFGLVINYTLNGRHKSLGVPPPTGTECAVTGPADSYSLGYKFLNTHSRPMTTQELRECARDREGC
jgi:hypothetical protein